MTTLDATTRAFREVFEAHGDAIARYCLRRLSPPDAQDAAAEVFLVAWRRIEEMPVGDDALLWLYGVARNVVRNSHRARGRAERLSGRLRREPLYADPGPEMQIVRREEEQELVAAMQRLSNDDQEVLRLRAYERLTIPQISQVVGCSEEAAKKRVKRALKRLRALVPTADAAEGPQLRAREEGGGP